MAAQQNPCEVGMKVSCSSGNRQIGLPAYQTRGKEVTLENGERAYLASPGCVAPTKLGVVLAYDRFGCDVINTRRFADMLADQANAHVLMPDFFHVQPLSSDNFPPKNGEELAAGKWDVVSSILSTSNLYLQSLLTPESSQALGIIGLSWGGKQVLAACSHTGTLGYRAGVSIHGVSLAPEDAENVGVPVFLMLSGEDPSIETLKTILDRKPFGDRCRYYTFSEESHGFAAAQGDLNNQATLEAVNQTITLTAAFLMENVGTTGQQTHTSADNSS